LSQKNGIQLREDFIKTCDSDEDAGFMAVAELLNSNERPDAIIINGDVMVKSAIRAARKFKVKIPEDIEILNYGDSDDSPCCLVSKPLFEMGETAVELLKKIIKDDKIKKTRNVVPLKG
jgi:DNA-binding LacI/PurR family transcriptional regulator